VTKAASATEEHESPAYAVYHLIQSVGWPACTGAEEEGRELVIDAGIAVTLEATDEVLPIPSCV
jgi:hypothetical protein